MKHLYFAVTLVGISMSSALWAVDDQAPKVRYKQGKQMDFDSRQVQGEMRRPDVAPVIGNEANKNNGILRLRENFMDKMTADAAGELE